MSIPSNGYELLSLLALVLPGVVYAAVRTAVRGWGARDREIGSQLLQAFVVGAVLDAAYLLLLGDAAVNVLRKPASIAETPRAAALAILVLAVIVPATLAYFIHGRPSWEKPGTRWLLWLRVPVVRSGYETTPTAWDKVAPTRGGHWVRVRVGEGKWVGGWIGNRSFVSTYPESPDLYIEEQHHVAPDGTIGDPVPESAGVWLKLKEGDIVEWIRP